jgi:hypothetical protein
MDSWDQLTLVREFKQLFGPSARGAIGCISQFLSSVGEDDEGNMDTWAAFFAQQMAPSGQQADLAKILAFMAEHFSLLM